MTNHKNSDTPKQYNTVAINAIIWKDIREVLSSPMTLAPMLIVPLLFTVLLPVGMIFLTQVLPTSQINGMENLDVLLKQYVIPSGLTKAVDQFAYIFLNYSFVAFFLIIPLMVTIIIAVNGIVGERERKTLETLLTAPISHRDFLTAKLLAALLPGIAIAWISWILMFTTANLTFLAFTGQTIINALTWLPVLLLLAPAVTAFGLAFALLASLKAKTFMEAQQLSALVVLPVVMLLPIQLSGLLVFNLAALIIMSLIFLGLTALLIRLLAPRFSREAVVARL